MIFQQLFFTLFKTPHHFIYTNSGVYTGCQHVEWIEWIRKSSSDKLFNLAIKYQGNFANSYVDISTRSERILSAVAYVRMHSTNFQHLPLTTI